MAVSVKKPERSPLIDKNVVIRHATETDRVRIEGSLPAFGLAGIEVRDYELTVAVEGSVIIGVAGLRRLGDARDTACVFVAEKRRNRGVGAAMVRHLIEYSPIDRVLVTTDLAKMFRSLGFAETPTDEESRRLLGIECGTNARRGAVLMAYEKR